MENHKHTAFITIVLFAGLLLSVINYRNIEVLESRINTVTKYKDEQSKLDSEKTFKEDYYITQQSHDTNLTLVVFGVLVALSGFFTYKNIDIKFEEKAKEMNQQIFDLKKELQQIKTTTENETIEINKLIENFRIDFYVETGSVSSEIANFHLEQNNIAEYYYYSIGAMSKASDYVLSEFKTASKEETLETRNGILKELTLISDNIGAQIELGEVYFRNTSNYIAKIRKLDDDRIDHILSILHSKTIGHNIENLL